MAKDIVIQTSRGPRTIPVIEVLAVSSDLLEALTAIEQSLGSMQIQVAAIERHRNEIESWLKPDNPGD